MKITLDNKIDTEDEILDAVRTLLGANTVLVVYGEVDNLEDLDAVDGRLVLNDYR